MDKQEGYVEKVETVCRHCVFAEFSEGEAKQFGCQIDVLSKMKSQGTKIQTNKDVKDNISYNSIPGRICVYNRNQTWADHFNNEGLIAVVRKEVRPQIGFIIISDGDLVGLQLTMTSILEMSQKPKFVCVAFTHTIKPTIALNILAKYFSKIPYRVELILEEGASHERVVDICFKKFDGQYFASFESGQFIPPNFIAKIDEALNDRLERFLLLKPIHGIHGMVAQRIVTKQIGGFSDDTLMNKLERVANQQKCLHLIKNVQEIVPSLNYLS